MKFRRWAYCSTTVGGFDAFAAPASVLPVKCPDRIRLGPFDLLQSWPLRSAPFHSNVFGKPLAGEGAKFVVERCVFKWFACEHNRIRPASQHRKTEKVLSTLLGGSAPKKQVRINYKGARGLHGDRCVARRARACAVRADGRPSEGKEKSWTKSEDI